METTVIYILCGLMVIYSIFGLIGLFIKISNQIKRDLLEKMYKNGDIDNDIYKKYL